MICLAAFRRSQLSLSSFLSGKNATSFVGRDSCQFSSSASTGQSKQGFPSKTSNKPKDKVILLYKKTKTTDHYIFWYKGFFIGFPLLLTCAGPFYTELVTVMYSDPGFLRYFCFVVPALAVGALYKLIHAWGLRFPQKVEYTKDRMLNMHVIAWPGKMKCVSIDPGKYAVRNDNTHEFRLTEPSKIVSYGYVFDKRKGSLRNQKVLNRLFQPYDPKKTRQYSIRNQL